QGFSPAAATARSTLQSAQQFLYSVTMGALRGSSSETVQREPPSIPLPLMARTTLLNLREGKLASADALAAEADALLRAPAAVQRGRRALQLAVTGTVIVVMPVVVVVALRMQISGRTTKPESFMLDATTSRLQTLDKKIRTKPVAEEIEERD